MTANDDNSLPSTAKNQIALDIFHRHREGSRSFTLNISTSVPASGITAICGPSGAGKTTLLRCIAGLEPSAKLSVRFGDSRMLDLKQHSKPHLRQIGYVFQQALLFPHLNVLGNLRYAEKRRAKTERPIHKYFQFSAVIELLGIGHLLQQMPDSLSGGEKQRVAIARALLSCPKMLLMDEPLASLDDARKAEFLPYLERLQTELSLPILYVSHSMREIARLADHVLLLENGDLTHSASASKTFTEHELFASLEEERGVIVDAVITQRDPEWHLICAAFSGGKLWLSDNGERIGQKVRLNILAKDISLMTSEPQDTSIQNRISGTIITISAENAAMSLVTLRSNDIKLVARITNRAIYSLNLKINTQVYALIKAVAIVR